MTDNVLPFPPSDKPDNRGDFFAVDRRAMVRACELGLNPAVAYLVLARFTGGDNRTEKAGTKSVEVYTGISRPRAKEAIQALVNHGLVSSPIGNHIRKITPAHEVPGCEGFRIALDDEEQNSFMALGDDLERITQKHANAMMHRLVKKGYVLDRGNDWFQPAPYDEAKAAEPDWVWLPNAIVTGAADETAPLELIRQCQDVMLLRLFIDLYHTQSLANDGGIHWRQIRREFTREKIGGGGFFTVWGFKQAELRAWSSPFVKAHLTAKNDPKNDLNWEPFFDRIKMLEQLGLVEMVGRIIEADTDTAEPIHSYAIGNGILLERQLAEAAQKAAERLLTTSQVDWARENNFHLVPVLRHISDVQMFGVGRLRYKPRTAATAVWYAKLCQTCNDLIPRYNNITLGNSDAKSAELL